MGTVVDADSRTRGQRGVTIASAPVEEALSGHYTLKVDGRDVPVYACRVSAMPFNQVWPGYQRPVDQTELAGFAYWDMDGPVHARIESQQSVESVVVRPLSAGVVPVVEGNRISLELDHAQHVIVQVNDDHHALHLFASPPEEGAPQPDDEGVRYFGPGVHRPGRIDLDSNETVYVAAGAVVYGSVHATGVTGIAVRGRGILDVSPFDRGKGGGAIRFSDCSDVTVEGIVMRDPDVWCCSLFGCRNATIDNVKLIGLWRYNADGIDVCNSQNVTVRNCFVRAFDDALVVKGLKFRQNSFDDRPVANVRFSHCVVWCDWGRAMEIGAETCAPEIENVTFEDCDIVRTTHIAMDIQHGDRAVVRDILFDRVRVEMDERALPPRMQGRRDEQYGKSPSSYRPRLMNVTIHGTNYSKDTTRGTVRNVRFREIDVYAPRMPDSLFAGSDPEHSVRDVTIEGLRLNGTPVENVAAARVTVREHVHGISVRRLER